MERVSLPRFNMFVLPPHHKPVTVESRLRQAARKTDSQTGGKRSEGAGSGESL